MPSTLVSVVYPSAPNAKFDLEYYKNKHMDLVFDKWNKHGLKQFWIADLRKSGGPYDIQCTMLWDTGLEGFQKAAASEDSAVVFADVANFASEKPIILSGEVVKSSL